MRGDRLFVEAAMLRARTGCTSDRARSVYDDELLDRRSVRSVTNPTGMRQGIDSDRPP
jgi:hypothetical protein